MEGNGTYKDCRFWHIVRFGKGPVRLFADRSLHQPTIYDPSPNIIASMQSSIAFEPLVKKIYLVTN